MKNFKKSSQLGSNMADIMIGMIYKEKGNLKQAFEYFKKATESGQFRGYSKMAEMFLSLISEKKPL